MPKVLWPPTVDDNGLFTRKSALAEGWTDQDLRKNTGIYRILHGVYANGNTPLTHPLKCGAVSLVMPPDAVITGRSAVTLRGLPLAAAHDRVEVIVSDRGYMNRRLGTRCWSVRTWPGEYVPWNGMRLATVERAALDLLARNPLKTGVAAVDAMLHSGLLGRADLARFLAGRHDHGIVKARRAFEFLDGRAESPPESTLRVTLVLAGFHPEPQVEIHDHAEFVARVDLGFRREKVAVEYDGAWHGDPDQAVRDQRRRDRLRDNGWTVIVVTAQQLHSEPAEVVARVGEALAAKARWA